jgi:hypothetical protein
MTYDLANCKTDYIGQQEDIKAEFRKCLLEIQQNDVNEILEWLMDELGMAKMREYLENSERLPNIDGGLS